MKIKLLSALILTLIAGCVTNKGGYRNEEGVEAKLLTMNQSEVLAQLGEPTKKTNFVDGKQVWRYESKIGSDSIGRCTLSVTLEGRHVTSATLHPNDVSPVTYPLSSCKDILRTLSPA